MRAVKNRTPMVIDGSSGNRASTMTWIVSHITGLLAGKQRDGVTVKAGVSGLVQTQTAQTLDGQRTQDRADRNRERRYA
jgi:hypothetical protein